VSARARRRFRVALTGGIASGKSTVAGFFAALGVPVIDMDAVAREVVEPGTPLLAAIFERFGPGIRRPDGSLDRAALRAIVFADPAARRDLEALTHPAIREAGEAHAAAAAGPYVMMAIPLLAETGGRGRFDRVLVVDCAESAQLARLQSRDGSSPEQARAILAAQATRAQRLAIADDVIANDGSLDDLRRQAEAVHARYLELARAAGQ
jgi:dephospho-CoA kinase